MPRRLLTWVSFSALFLTVAASSVSASQRPRRSQPGLVRQTVRTTDITVTYNRPVARGRQLFGGVVRWGETWNPGADQATYIEFSKDVEVDGRPLAAGKYSLWAVPQPDRWTIIFSTAWNVYHVPYPDGRDALRLSVESQHGSHMEVMAFYFPVVDPDSTLLTLHWGETLIQVPIRVTE